MKRAVLLVLALAAWTVSAGAQGKISTLLTNGPTSRLMNIVILAEGFTAGQEASFTNQAKAVLNTFLSTAPYKSYRSYFNGFAIFVASPEEGSDHPSQNIFRNTYFNSTYESYGIDRLLTIPPNDRDALYANGRGKVDALLQKLMPEYDIVLLLVNDGEYGGSGGVPAVTSVNASSAEIAIHEIGHSFAGLGDEYSDSYPGFPDTEEPNTTMETRRSSIKWRNWILPSTPVPTPPASSYESVVGLFEGAHYHSTGWYRPKYECKMRSLGTAFCEVCAEAIVLAEYGRVDLILSQSPAGTNIHVAPGSATELSVQTLVPSDHSLVFTWLVDGTTNRVSGSNSFLASPVTLPAGTHEVTVVVKDATSLVRTDPQARLTERRSWTVTVPASQPPQISSVSGQTTVRGTSVSLQITVSDPDTPVEQLIISGRSSNTNLIRDEEILISGTGTNREVTLNPENCAFGNATITLAVSDGSGTAETRFGLNVIDILEPPSLDPISDQSVVAGTSRVIPLIASVPRGDCYPVVISAVAADTSVIASSNIVVSGTWTNATLTIRAGMNDSGVTRITVRLSDGSAAAQQTFNLTVAPLPVARPPVISGDKVMFEFSTTAALPLVLEESTDLFSWVPLKTNVASAIMHTVPLTNAPAEFFRARVLAP